MKDARSVQLMTAFVKSGGYRSLKLAEEKKKQVVLGVKRHLQDSELTRQEFQRFGLVAKYSVKRDYEWDYIGLNEYLADLGLLIPVITMLPDKSLKTLDVYDDVKKFELPPKSYTLRPYFNNEGKAFNAFKEEEVERTYNNLSLEMLLNVFDATNRELEGCQKDYDSIKQKIISCPVLQKQRKIKYDLGSLSILAKKEGYDINAILNNYGIDFLINYGKPNMDKLNEFILQGTITQSEVYQFRKDITFEDKGMKFTLMTIEDEQKQLQMLRSQTLRASLAVDAKMKGIR